jgi:hypothetical protein
MMLLKKKINSIPEAVGEGWREAIQGDRSGFSLKLHRFRRE